jgi:hypothetical protein
LVPGTFENFPFSLKTHLPGSVGDNVGTQASVAQRSPAVGADVAHRHERIAQIEDADPLAATNRINASLAHRNVVDWSENAPSVDNLEGSQDFDIVEGKVVSTLAGPLVAHVINIRSQRSRCA